MKIKNKTLFIVLAALVLVLVILKFTGSKRTAKTLDTNIVQIDTAKITRISIYPSTMKGEEVLFNRGKPGWSVSCQGVSGEADQAAVTGALAELTDLKTERLVSRSKEKWPEFLVDDSLGTRVVIREGRRQTLDLVIGKFDYQQPTGGYQGYGRNQISGLTYVRVHDKDEVYAVEGFLAMSFNRNFNAWRNQSVLDLNTPKVSKMVFEYPSDSGFMVQKSESGWMAAGLSADSASVAEYLTGIARKRSAEFVDDVREPAGTEFRITFEGENMSPVRLKAFVQANGSYLINSSSNPDSWFRSDSTGIFRDIFIPASGLLKSIQ